MEPLWKLRLAALHLSMRCLCASPPAFGPAPTEQTIGGARGGAVPSPGGLAGSGSLWGRARGLERRAVYLSTLRSFLSEVWGFFLPGSVQLVFQHANRTQTLLSFGSSRARFFFLGLVHEEVAESECCSWLSSPRAPNVGWDCSLYHYALPFQNIPLNFSDDLFVDFWWLFFFFLLIFYIIPIFTESALMLP